ncbi:Mrpl49 [Kluyveromyces lactis]|nr:Mrpl49 [Kluyveromyces lactis]
MFKNISHMFVLPVRQIVGFSPLLHPLKRSFIRTTHSVAEKAKVDLTPLKLSNELYAVFRIHNRPYLVTEGDKVILPFKLKQAEVGDVLNLTDVTTIGSRNFKLVDEPIDPSLYTIKATVLEKTKRPLRVREVTKRRNRKVRHAVNKADLTILRISELKVN